MSKKASDPKPATLWRKPITLEDQTDTDPLAVLYRGREVAEAEPLPQVQSVETVTKATVQKQKRSRPVKQVTDADHGSLEVITEPPVTPENQISTAKSILPADKLRSLLRIKDENYQCSDIREILRGKSLELYAYLCHRAGNSGTCKLKTQDLMSFLDISRPTLFKQSDWLVKLSLISKQNIPGDHFGTVFTVNKAIDVLPVGPEVIKQIDAAVSTYKAEEE